MKHRYSGLIPNLSTKVLNKKRSVLISGLTQGLNSGPRDPQSYMVITGYYNHHWINELVRVSTYVSKYLLSGVGSVECFKFKWT